MSVAIAHTSSSSMFAPSRRGSESLTGVSWEETRPIPWEQRHAGSSSSISNPPQIMVWRTHAESGSAQTRSSSVMSALGCNTAASRSRVSMDALPVEEDSDSHATISPSSSSASLPIMDEMPPPPRATAIQPAPFARPVGLGLSAVRPDGDRQEWPPAQPQQHDEPGVESDDDEVNDQHEMENYMASHRAPVDATLRSMPGVVGLGDGWAGGPQNKPKKRGWFRRKQKEEAPAEADPLALWAVPADNNTECTSPVTETSIAADPGDNKWWKSKKNLFGASQRALPTSPPPTMSIHSEASSSSPSKSARQQQQQAPPSAAKPWRSKLNFGSMVDLRRTPEQRATGTTTTFPSTSLDETTPTPVPNKRHSIAGLLRKPPPHPLELSHSTGGTPASRSQPVAFSASSSQPSLLSPTSHHHPMLRQAYARSESNVAGVAASHGLPPRPAPLIINSGAFTNTAPMPMWRPPMMSPTPLLGVQEEDEEEHEAAAAEPPADLALKRSATFGDDEEYTAQKASAPPGLSDITGSPMEGSRALSVSTEYSSKHSDLAPPQHNFLNRLKTVLTLGRGRKPSFAKSVATTRAPESPRSFQSEQIPPTSHPAVNVSHMSNSVGRGARRRSRLFSRNRGNIEPMTTLTPRPVIDESPPVALSPLLQTPPAPQPPPTPQKEPKAEHRASVHSSLGIGATLGVLTGSPRNRRTSWAAPIPVLDDDGSDDEDERPTRRVEKRLSRVSLRRFKGQSKQRPPLGTVFPRPPTEMQAPPSLHWAFPASYSTPMLHKFGGSTLSLALDISAEGVPSNNGLDDIQESPTRSTADKVADRRERALSATIAALTARQSSPSPSPNPNGSIHSTQGSSSLSGSLRARRTVPINIENLNSSNDSLTLPSCSVVDFPLPPSDSSGDVSSPDPDHVEHLCTPRDARAYPTLPPRYMRRRNDVPGLDSGDSGEESAASSSGSSSSQRLRKQPSWSTCKTSGETVGSGRVTPLATPTSSASAAGDDEARCSSYGSLITAIEGEPSDAELTPRAPAYTAKRMTVMHPAGHIVV